MIVFLSGPMSGILDHNYPAFARVADTLRRAGFTVLSPHEIPPKADWSGYMRASLRLLLESDLIVLLPGWEVSRGARRELDVARDVGLDVRLWSDADGEMLSALRP